MNFINRLIVVMVLLFGLLAGCALFFVALIPNIALNLAAALQPSFAALTDTQQYTPLRLVCLGTALLFPILALVLLYLELMPSGKMRMHLKSIQGADVLMSGDAIVNQLQYALDPLPGVIRARPQVFRGKGDVVDVLLDMTTTSDVDVKKKTDEVMDVTRSVLEGGLGLRVGKVQIKLEQVKAPKRGAATPPTLNLPKLVAAKQEEANENAASSS
jgi:hypothetical protein